MKIEAGQQQLNPIAILAAVIENIGKTQEVEIPMDDSAETQTITAKTLGTAQEPNAMVCLVPLASIMKYNNTPYAFQIRVQDGAAVLFFEKQDTHTPLLNSLGQKITASKSDTLERLLEKVS